MTTDIQSIDLDCGVTLLVEANPSMRSVGFSWLLPAGNAYDPDDRVGVSTAISDWIWRGAGDLDTKALSDALDRIGIQRNSSVETHHFHLSATMIGDRLSEALPHLVSLVRRPVLGDDTFEPVRDLCLQSLSSLRDDPQTRSMFILKERHFPAPFNRSTFGTVEGLKALTPVEARAHWKKHAIPGGSIIGISGNVNAAAAASELNDLLGDRVGGVDEKKEAGGATRGYLHEPDESTQCHICVAFDAPCERDAESMVHRVATAALSGGMSGRLFTEVREKRALCYSVYASYSAGRDRGAVLSYVGTTPDRAQEAIDVLLAEFGKMREGIDESEFERAVIGMKSRLVMHGESTSARAASMARDQYLVGRPRTLSELESIIDGITVGEVNEYLAGHPFGAFTVVSLGPNELVVPG